ncbi:MAG: hypothetical protein CTY28_14665 [Hyphomicrobium sp.]|jgi:hypothetical protein|nr:MAG: hypothetical protein CTY28_14665 [Hyphomicrobium sp.]
MQRILSVLILGGGLAFLAGEFAPSPSDREEQMAAMTRIVARATILEPDTVPAELPDLRRPIASPAAATATIPSASSPPAGAPPTDTAALATVTIATPSTTSIGQTSGADIQRRLAREIQAELKRVGCYSGRLDGSWGDRSRSAMTTFMARVNAQLPTTEPDVFLLSLIKGQTDAVCGPTCSGNEVSEGGRCVARTVVADSAHPETPTARTSEPNTSPPAAIASVRTEPLPGRMSIGGPVSTGGAPQAVTAAPVEEALPWRAPVRAPTGREPKFAALTPQDDSAGPIIKAPPAPRRVTKVRRNWAAPARPKPVKRRYSSQRTVQMLFLHPLGRM